MRILQTLFLGLAIFSIDFASHAQWQPQRLYTFTNAAAEGTPAFITQGADGNFYGTVIYSGVQGRFFKMTPAGAVTLYPPPISATVNGLNAELAPADDGGFYATTTTNVSFPFPSLGLIVKLAPSGQVSTAFTFNPLSGGRPSSIRRGLDGCFYGITTGTNTVAFRPPIIKPFSDFQRTTRSPLCIR
jgi:hypothetical protein